MTGRARRKLGLDPIEIHPSGRPVKGAGYEALFALALVLAWVAIMGGLFALIGKGGATAGLWPTFSLIGICCLCWAYAEFVVGRRRLIWPGSALGLLGPLSLGFAAALSTPELRTGPFLDRLSLVSIVSGAAMIPFLFRFKLPGLVSPIITFSLVGLFLELYGGDMNKLREVEGFSPRGIIAALTSEPLFMVLFGASALMAAVYARKLDMKGGNFGLAAARPLHLVGAGVLALVAGRLLAMLPNPADIAALALLWIATHLWALRVNRIGVAAACHFAMAKPMVMSIAAPLGLMLGLQDWSVLLTAVLLFDIATWPLLHKCSRAVDWTLGPGGRRPPRDRKGWLWRYWPYALENDAPAGADTPQKDPT